MLYKEGKKYFYIPKSATTNLVHNHLNRLRQIFEELVTKIISIDCRVNVRFNNCKTGSHAIFTVMFGQRMYKSKLLHSILTKIAETSLLTLKAERNLEIAQKDTEKIEKQYRSYIENKPQIEY